MKTLSGLVLPEAVEKCEEVIGYRFQNRELLESALTHASGASSRLESNERLEFLGDAILATVVCNELYHRFPTALEGELTKIKSAVVSRRTCAKISKRTGLGDLLFLGKGMIGRTSLPVSLLAAVFESIIAAIYLDSDMATAEAYILRCVRPVIDEITTSQTHQNFKSQLQQHAQREMTLTPVYEVLDEQGPDHNKCFEISVRLGDQRFSSAWGSSKKEAEQLAAEKALVEIGLIEAQAEKEEDG